MVHSEITYKIDKGHLSTTNGSCTIITKSTSKQNHGRSMTRTLARPPAKPDHSGNAGNYRYGHGQGKPSKPGHRPAQNRLHNRCESITHGLTRASVRIYPWQRNHGQAARKRIYTAAARSRYSTHYGTIAQRKELGLSRDGSRVRITRGTILCETLVNLYFAREYSFQLNKCRINTRRLN